MHQILNEMRNQKVPLHRRAYFWLTCWKPITKYELFNFQLLLVSILEGIKESDLQHYQIEKAIIEDVKKLATYVLDSKPDLKTGNDKNKDMYG